MLKQTDLRAIKKFNPGGFNCGHKYKSLSLRSDVFGVSPLISTTCTP